MVETGYYKTGAEGDYVNYVETSFTKIGYINLGYTFPTKMIKKLVSANYAFMHQYRIRLSGQII